MLGVFCLSLHKMQKEMNKYIFILTIFLVFSLPILAQSADLPTEISDVHNIIKQKYAPDGRTAIFKPTYTVDGKNILLGGQTTSDEARTELLSALKAKGYNILTSLKVLPQESGLGETCWGIVKNSVCNLRSAADYGAENVTQAQMGMPVRIIQKTGPPPQAGLYTNQAFCHLTNYFTIMVQRTVRKG